MPRKHITREIRISSEAAAMSSNPHNRGAMIPLTLLDTQIIKPKRPSHGLWLRLPDPPEWVSMGYVAEAWFHPAERIQVISAVEVAHDDDGIDKGPEYHISISRQTGNGVKRISSMDAKQVVRMFDMEGAEEDNHVVRGVVRNFWKPVNESLVGLECSCKARESAIVEDKGDFVWRGTEDMKK